MADIVNEQGKEPEVSKEDMEKLESVKKADAAVKSMHDFTSPGLSEGCGCGCNSGNRIPWIHFRNANCL